MKYAIFILAFVLLGTLASAQSISKENIPAVVLNAFQLKFPNAKDIKWKLNNGSYEVKCKVNDKENKVVIDYKGQVVRHQQDLYVSEIPDHVLKIIRSKAPLFDLSGADKFVEGGKTRYEVNFKINGKRQYFWIDDKGNLVKYRKELNDNEIPASIMNFINTKIGPLDDIDRAKYVEDNGKRFYIIAGKGHVFLFDDQVNLWEHNQNISQSKIPAPIMNTVNDSYKGYVVRNAYLIEKRGVTTYTLRLQKSGKRVNVTFNPEGRILNVK